MFIGFFPLSFFWLKRAWAVAVRKDYSYVALKRGIPPPNPQRYAIYSILINLIPGSIIAALILLIAVAGLNYNTWTAIAGTTIWVKIFAEFILSRHAHVRPQLTVSIQRNPFE
jgi:hypothetical protein